MAKCMNCGKNPPLRFKVLDDSDGDVWTFYLCSFTCMQAHSWVRLRTEPDSPNSEGTR